HCLSLALVEDRAPQLDDAVADDGVDEILRSPGLLGELGEDPVADLRIRFGARGHLTGHARQRMQQIGTAEDSDDTAAAHHRQPLDAALLHRPHDLVERGISPIVTGSGVMISAILRPWLWTYSSASRPGPSGTRASADACAASRSPRDAENLLR